MVNENDTLYAINFETITGVTQKVEDGFVLSPKNVQEYKTAQYFISLDEAIDQAISKLETLKQEYLQSLDDDCFTGVPWMSDEDKKQILAEYSKGDDSYWCCACGYKCCLDRGKHFQCQMCGCDWEYGGNRFKEPEKFEKFRTDMITKLNSHTKRFTE